MLSGTEVWVILATSESGDHYGPIVLSVEPEEYILKEIAHKWDGDEDMAGCGDYGSYVYLSVRKCIIDPVKI